MKIFTSFLIFVSIISFGQTVAVNGSEAMLPLMKELADSFLKSNFRNKAMSIHSSGSKVGIDELLNDEIHICTSTRDLTIGERKEFSDKGEKFVVFPICLEALVILVSYSNNLEKITKKQLCDLFTGKIANFKEIGGNDQMVKLFIRSNTSGCYLGFKEMIMDNKNYSETALMMNDNWQIKSAMYKYNGAISFLGYSEYKHWKSKEASRSLKVSIDGKEYFGVSNNEIASGKYPFSRFCYLIYKVKYEDKLMPFLKFIETEEAKEVIIKNGFVSLR